VARHPPLRQRGRSAEELRRVVSEASKAFGKPEVFVEKCVVRPKHIEVQILGDTQATSSTCSSATARSSGATKSSSRSRRARNSPRRSGNTSASCGACRQGRGYVNAGTVEFLLDQDNQFYFMEMNTRLQVEHPITETITGVDIVQEQIRIADGQPLQYKQDEIKHRGYAIEFRVNAEDPKNEFLPSLGRITRYYSPGGPACASTRRSTPTTSSRPTSTRCAPSSRCGISPGIHGRARPSRTGRHAGVRCENDDSLLPGNSQESRVRSGRFNTSFVESHPELTQYTEKKPPEVMAAAIAAAIAAHQGL